MFGGCGVVLAGDVGREVAETGVVKTREKRRKENIL